MPWKRLQLETENNSHNEKSTMHPAVEEHKKEDQQHKCKPVDKLCHSLWRKQTLLQILYPYLSSRFDSNVNELYWKVIQIHDNVLSEVLWTMPLDVKISVRKITLIHWFIDSFIHSFFQYSNLLSGVSVGTEPQVDVHFHRWQGTVLFIINLRFIRVPGTTCKKDWHDNKLSLVVCTKMLQVDKTRWEQEWSHCDDLEKNDIYRTMTLKA